MDLEQCLGFCTHIFIPNLDASFQSIILPDKQRIQKIDQQKLTENFHLKINLKLQDIITAKNIDVQKTIQKSDQKINQNNRIQTQKENKFRF